MILAMSIYIIIFRAKAPQLTFDGSANESKKMQVVLKGSNALKWFGIIIRLWYTKKDIFECHS